MDYPDGSIYSTVEFDTAKTLWRIADVITRDKAGNVSRSEQKKAADAGWNEIIPGTFGKSLYQHYVLTDMPDLENIHPLPVYTDVVSGSSFSIDRDSASYKNGYAEFWLIASYRKGNQPLYSVIYRVKMNMAYKKVMTLSATEYDPVSYTHLTLPTILRV